MQIVAPVTAPPRHVSPVKSAAPSRRPSPLNPTRTRAAAPTITNQPPPVLATTSGSSTSTHLANLERLLKRPAPAPTPPPPPLPDVVRGEEEGVPQNSDRRGGFLNGLNLSGIVPATRKVEDMSPRSLGMIHRLLDGTPRPSPRNGIARRWRELHGADDWSGLLDPLDEDLRREIVRYGEFVQAAYHAFHADLGKRPSDPRHVALPDRSYRVTRGLYATSSIEVPRWVDGMAPWMRQQSSWIGFVAVCDSEREIQRMGRRDIVIALRGTATALEWAENFRATLVDIPHDGGSSASRALSSNVGVKVEATEPVQTAEPRVECGFWSLFTTGSKRGPSLQDAVVEEVRRLMEIYKGEQLSITVTGHSLGAALAVLVADELRARGTGPQDMLPVAVFSFGGPHVGNRAFADRVRARRVKVLRVVNERDVITKVPGVFAGQQKVAEEEKEAETESSSEVRRRWRRAAFAESKRVRLAERWWDTVERAMRAWAYAHVGSELRVDSRQSPYLRPDADPGCCHDLEAYLHLVDGFLSSNCPFRANAKRSIAKLVTQQGSNVKKHYTSKALAALGMQAAALDAALGDRTSGCLPSPSSS